MRPHRRYSFWFLTLLGVIALIPQVVPSFSDKVPWWVTPCLAFAGMAAQYIKQEIKADEQVHKKNLPKG